MIICVYLVFLYLASSNSYERRLVKAIIGRNASFTFALTTKDVIKVNHDGLKFLTVWPNGQSLLALEKEGKIRVSVDIALGGTMNVTIHVLNITTNNAGVYTVTKLFDSKEFNDSVVLRTIEASVIPRIDEARHISVDSSLVLQCVSSSLFARKIIWKCNSSLIENQDKYSLHNNSLLIKRLTAGDHFNLYTCMEQGSEFESDPYRIISSGPGDIWFTPNITVVFEHGSLNISCNSDYDPVCAWQWTRTHAQSGLEKAVSSENILQINNITGHDAGKYSCKVQNILSGTSFARSLSLDVKYTDYYIITTAFQRDDIEANAMTTSNFHKDDANDDGLPSKHLLMYLVVGFGVLLAIGFFTCLFKKFRKCLPMGRVGNTIIFQDSGEGNPPEENQAERYWTIVSNAEGEMSTALETTTKQITEPAAICFKLEADENELEALPQLHRVEADMELDGYIHPIHTDSLSAGFATRHITEV